ncbi:TPA: glycosyltransferase family 1 protein, partial [Vibrio cholerae]
DNYLHASLYLMSDIVLHPSNVEGGLGAYPQYEASSVGKPSLINTGRHVNEMAEEGFDVDLLSSNFVNTKETVDKIEKLINSEEYMRQNIDAINRLKISWKESASNYENVFFGNENA